MIRTYNFNHGWRFHEGDVNKKNYDVVGSGAYDEPQWLKAGNNGVAIKNLDDSDWIPVKIPHDFVIERCEFTPDVSPNVGSLRKNISWYRKTFKLPTEIKDKRIFIKFDAVFRDSQVWCNGHFMGRHLGGYMGFCYELTEVLDKNGTNTVAVCADARASEGWWYEGGGIYRDVHLIATPSIRVSDNGVFVKPYNINLADRSCDLDIEVEVDSNRFDDVTAEYDIKISDKNGAEVARCAGNVFVSALSSATEKCTVKLSKVQLWDVKEPNLYSAQVAVTSEGNEDVVTEKFGVRKIEYSPDKGMLLNGNEIFMKGVCGHDDFAGVGVALNYSLMKYKVESLIEMGCNAYRCAHNPPSPLFLDICDEFGFLVIDETRLPGTSREMMEDYINLIKRDRNHPSVVFFSMGNEEMNIQHNRIGTNIFSKMQAIGKKYDDSRDYLYAINANINKNVDFIEADGLHLPVHGVNYITNRYDPCMTWLNERHPTCCFISTESTGIASVRGYKMDSLTRPPLSEDGIEKGVWANKANEGLLTCYGDFTPVWSFNPELSIKEHFEKNYMLGAFLWTGMDYRGEVFPYQYPQVVSSYGIIDYCGFFKDWAYYVKAWWCDEDVLHIFPSWNLPEQEGTEISVWAFGNCEEVELVLNGRSLGKKPLDKFCHLEWKVPYEKGTIEAYGYSNGEKVLHEKSVTSGIEYELRLTTQKKTLLADCDDSAVVTVEVCDKNGNIVSDSEIEVEFAVSGAGTIKGVGNGNPLSHEHDKASKRKLYAGKAIVIVEGVFESGEIILTASSKDVISATMTIICEPSDNSRCILDTMDIDYGAFRVKVVDI